MSKLSPVVNPSKEYLEGDKKLELTISLQEANKFSGDSLSAKLEDMSGKAANGLLSTIYASFAAVLTDLESSNDEKAKVFIACANTSANCTVVYYACGTYGCANNYGRVEYYCDHGDFWQCSQCWK